MTKRIEYKGFIVIQDDYYIEVDEIKGIGKATGFVEYEINNHLLIVVINSKRDVYRMNKYQGNKTIYDAIDVYDEYKDKSLLTSAHTHILDFWFDKLKRNASDFYNTFGFGSIDVYFADFDSCIKFWHEFRSKDKDVAEFLTDEKIKEFWSIQKENKLIKRAKAKMIDLLVDY